jgi:hypothetical protein
MLIAELSITTLLPLAILVFPLSIVAGGVSLVLLFSALMSSSGGKAERAGKIVPVAIGLGLAAVIGLFFSLHVVGQLHDM